MSHIKDNCNPRWTPRGARGSSDGLQVVSRVRRALKASWRASLCWIFGHRWGWALVRGDDGEPGGDSCGRCAAARANYALPCRCLGKTGPGIWGCRCEFEGFVGVE